jgi:hypothetical protein
LGLSIKEKASTAKVVIQPITGVKIVGGKLSSTFIAGDDAVCGSACTIDLYASSTSDEEIVLPETHQKRL